MKLATVRTLLQGMPADAELYCRIDGDDNFLITSLECVQESNDDPVTVILHGTI